MPSVMDGVNQRTQLVGKNRLELLLFNLGERQRYGINVFKVQEVIHCPTLTTMPNSAGCVRGIVNMRGKTISVIDLRMALGKSGMTDLTKSYVIVTEYNRKVQGLLVSGVDRIVNMNWNEVMPPPQGMGKRSYLTAVTRIDNELVEIIDVEKVLAEITGQATDVSESVKAEGNIEQNARYHVLVVDDSAVARNQIKRALDQIGMTTILANNGVEGLDVLKKFIADGSDINDHVSFVISDIEMPQMDGYTMTSEIRKNSDLMKLYVLMHTSLSGVFNNKLVEKAGADQFLPKFNPDEFAHAMNELIASGKVKPVIHTAGQKN